MPYCLLAANILTLFSLNQKAQFVYSYNEFEHLFLRYKLEGTLGNLHRAILFVEQSAL